MHSLKKKILEGFPTVEALYTPSWYFQGPKHERAFSLKFELCWVITYLQASNEKDQAGLINLNVQYLLTLDIKLQSTN